MNSFSNNIYGADRINQSIAVLGGATAQSYGAVGLSKPASHTEFYVALLDLETNVSVEDEAHASPDSASPVIKPFIDPSNLVSELRLPAVAVLDEQFESPVFSRASAVQNSELMSRFDAEQTELPAGLGVAETQNSKAGDTDADAPVPNSSDSLLSFIEQLIEQAQASSDEFNGSLDGGRQHTVRDLIEDLGSEPVLAVDYFGESAASINGVLDLAVQPIGSLSLPPVGPILANPRDEVAGFAS